MDYFDIDSIYELVEKSKKKLRGEMDNITFDNDKLSKENEKLLQLLEYSPKTRYLERDLIKSLPIIKLKPPPDSINNKNAKKTKHSKLPSTPIIDSYVMPQKGNQESREIAKDILNSIIDDAVEQSEDKDNQSNDSKKEEDDEDDDDDYYEKIMAQRQKQMEEREKKMQKDDDDDDMGMKGPKKPQEENNKGKKGPAFASRLSAAMNLLTKLKVYLFGTKTNFDINVSPVDTVKVVKSQILQILVDRKYDLKYTSANAYETTPKAQTSARRTAMIFFISSFPHFHFNFPRAFRENKKRAAEATREERRGPIAATQFLHTIGMPKRACVFTDEKRIPTV